MINWKLILTRIFEDLIDGFGLLIGYVLGLTIFITIFPRIALDVNALYITQSLNVTPANLMASLAIFVFFWSLGLSIWNIISHKETTK
jgi:hypothetical protein